MRYLLGFSYAGTKFTGFQRGTGERSVEDSILQILNKNSLGSNLRCCSRTDRGVSAIMNTCTIDSDRNAEDIIGILNSSLEDIYFHKYTMVSDDFNVRKVTFKKYIYLLPETGIFPFINIDDLKKFEGEHDFSNFCKLNGRNTVRTVTEVNEFQRNNVRYISFVANGFLWNQIRFMIGYAMERAREKETPDNPFSYEYRMRRLAPAQFLFLEEIVYDKIDFRKVIRKSTRKKVERSYMSSLTMLNFNKFMLDLTEDR